MNIRQVAAPIMVCHISHNAEEFWKIILDPQKNPDRHQNLIDSFFDHAQSLLNIS